MGKDCPQISIIVPVYNVEKYLTKCLDSLVKQTFSDIEIICVNDGSTDSSPQILEDYAKRDVRIKIITQKNAGASVARNTALDMARGFYIMFVDSDDWIEPDTCECAVGIMREHNTDLVMWDYVREYPSSSKPKNIFDQDVLFDEQAVRSRLHRRMVGIIGEELAHPENANALSTIWGKLYKRNTIETYRARFHDIQEIGSFEDGLFNLTALFYINSAVYMHRFFYHYRRTGADSITSRYRPQLGEQQERLYAILKAYIVQNNLDESYKTALRNRMALDLISSGGNILRKESGFRVTQRELKKILSVPELHDAYRELEKRYLPLQWRIFFYFAEKGYTGGLYVMLRVIQVKRNGK